MVFLLFDNFAPLRWCECALETNWYWLWWSRMISKIYVKRIYSEEDVEYADFRLNILTCKHIICSNKDWKRHRHNHCVLWQFYDYPSADWVYWYNQLIFLLLQHIQHMDNIEYKFIEEKLVWKMVFM